MASLPQFSSSINLNGRVYETSRLNFVECSLVADPPDPTCRINWGKVDSDDNEHKMKTEIEKISTYDMTFPICDMLTEKDRERILENAKKKNAISWIEV